MRKLRYNVTTEHIINYVNFTEKRFGDRYLMNLITVASPARQLLFSEAVEIATCLTSTISKYVNLAVTRAQENIALIVARYLR